MDEASRLVSELQQKLSELDHKVWKYGQDMAAEFEKYSEELLSDVSQDVSETVSKTIAEAMKDAPSLYPAGAAFPIESCACATGTLKDGVPVPIPVPVSVAGSITSTTSTPTAPISAPPCEQEQEMGGSPRSPHTRDLEFQGLFTPSYLPLLDNTSQRRSSPDQPISPTLKQHETEPLQVDASTDTRSLMDIPEGSRPPTPRRKNTDEVSVLSNTSEHSEGETTRRSALRRSSSASNKDRHSPRRVRFEVAGEEVLPTSSPSSMSELDGAVPTSLFSDEEEVADEMIEDIEKPPPKRISSSQALRALSRFPLADDGTQWTTVSAPPDGSASVATSNGISQDSSSEDLYIGTGASKLTLGDTNENGVLARVDKVNPVDSTDLNIDPEVSEDEDILDMPQLRRQGTPVATMLSPTNPPNLHDNKSPTASTRPRKIWQDLDKFVLGTHQVSIDDLKFDKNDEDEVFRFDEAASDVRSPPLEESQRYPDLEDEERDSFDTESPTSRAEAREVPFKYASSPARPIASIVRPTQTSENPSAGVVGSLRGHPFSLPIVSPEVHAHGAAFGPLDSFVGSVDGRSGLDASNPQSYRISGGFTGAPKSLSERMMMEDMMEANRNRRL
ncbi:uncharacterized protein L3040_000651 [Drepanopeziza brunnea f. sp. 'multigermtubi']|uniref:Uncharacterized protein n=1 Tax=Marssonina brunnea f. sp. multigermtubi (strain MB_m1) TaxID=1072389 RepID=K1Y847_MARBU|nr:uncharacterized protein MBM_00427 [Drepanopeziza brunnea f. sp. 'multigermtubi' MB_m1]EKD21314.1 hypothetical protein MBM_00427 [Drepanopeziza brunnea f. sp. 'multigermtubi' MB_m1]KAJ5054376.1 hypothetical protein L3040_000651 [Drepanopeziza brunnea f. sp. 'multigermtubi']